MRPTEKADSSCLLSDQKHERKTMVENSNARVMKVSGGGLVQSVVSSQAQTDRHSASLKTPCFLCRFTTCSLPFLRLRAPPLSKPCVLLLPAFASLPCLWVVREGLSVVLHQQCFKSLLQATASAFKHSYLTHPSWDQERSPGPSALEQRAILATISCGSSALLWPG